MKLTKLIRWWLLIALVLGTQADSEWLSVGPGTGEPDISIIEQTETRTVFETVSYTHLRAHET